jgi:hypothetical protein
MLLHKGTSEAFCQGKAPDFQECRVTTLQRFATLAWLRERLTIPDVRLPRTPGNGPQASAFHVVDGSSTY